MIISDTSILSSFAAARSLPLLLAVLEEDMIFIPPAVEQELRAGLARGITYLQDVLDLIPTGLMTGFSLRRRMHRSDSPRRPAAILRRPYCLRKLLIC